jgi:hypothetical protein
LEIKRTIDTGVGRGALAPTEEFFDFEAAFSRPGMTTVWITLLGEPSDLTARQYEIEQTTKGLRIRGDLTTEREEGLEQIVRPLSVPVVGWPGKAMTQRRLARGDEVDLFEQPVVAMVNLRLHDQPTVGAATVHLQGALRESWWCALRTGHSAAWISAGSSLKRRRPAPTRRNWQTRRRTAARRPRCVQ